MCLAAPMKIVEIYENGSAKVALDQVEHKVDMSLIDNPRTGEYVIVHAGFAIEKLDQEEADSRIKLFKELAESNQTPEL
jgi:hydrogenase expression/formation protein HypC